MQEGDWNWQSLLRDVPPGKFVEKRGRAATHGAHKRLVTILMSSKQSKMMLKPKAIAEGTADTREPRRGHYGDTEKRAALSGGRGARGEINLQK